MTRVVSAKAAYFTGKKSNCVCGNPTCTPWVLDSAASRHMENLQTNVSVDVPKLANPLQVEVANETLVDVARAGEDTSADEDDPTGEEPPAEHYTDEYHVGEFVELDGCESLVDKNHDVHYSTTPSAQCTGGISQRVYAVLARTSAGAPTTNPGQSVLFSRLLPLGSSRSNLDSSGTLPDSDGDNREQGCSANNFTGRPADMTTDRTAGGDIQQWIEDHLFNPKPPWRDKLKTFLTLLRGRKKSSI